MARARECVVKALKERSPLVHPFDVLFHKMDEILEAVEELKAAVEAKEEKAKKK